MTATPIANVVSNDVLVSYLQEIIVEYESYKKQFRRTESREPVSIPVEVTRLDSNLDPLGEPLHMVTRDMSAGGAGIFHNANLENGQVVLKFSSPVSLEEFQVLARVEHCTPCGHYFIVGCRFIHDVVEELR